MVITYRRTAMTQLLNWFKTVFSTNTYGHDLEAYIISKNPQNAAEVESLTREYQDKSFAWGRGL